MSILFIAVMAVLISSLFQVNPLLVAGSLALIGIVAQPVKGVFAMAITATIVDIRGKAYEPIIEELLFENKTVGEELVAFADDIKANTIVTEASTVVAMQAYTSGLPSASGSLVTSDVAITPVKVMYYQEFDPNVLRSSRFGRTMKAGAWNTTSTEFEKVVLGLYGRKISFDAESKFWNGITAATQTAIAALTPGTAQTSVGAAEQTYAASLTAGQFDGVCSRLIYNNGALGTRIKVAGTTITAANVKAEYDKVYAAIPAVVLNSKAEPPRIYAPYSHIQFINQFNNVATNFKNVFIVTDEGKPSQKVTFYGIEIVFVPVPENCIICAVPSYILWATDLVSDINYMEMNKIANNRDDMFVKNVFTIFAHVMNQKFNVYYQG